MSPAFFLPFLRFILIHTCRSAYVARYFFPATTPAGVVPLYVALLLPHSLTTIIVTLAQRHSAISVYIGFSVLAYYPRAIHCCAAYARRTPSLNALCATWWFGRTARYASRWARHSPVAQFGGLEKVGRNDIARVRGARATDGGV